VHEAHTVGQLDRLIAQALGLLARQLVEYLPDQRLVLRDRVGRTW